jgi:hypothetical protein
MGAELVNKIKLQEFEETLKISIKEKDDVIDKIKSLENKRNGFNMGLFVFLVLIYAVSYFAYLKRISSLLLIFSILLLFCIVLIILVQGFNTAYFFIFSDFCSAINGAMYKNEFPIDSISLGAIVSCYSIVLF